MKSILRKPVSANIRNRTFLMAVFEMIKRIREMPMAVIVDAR